jgi:hypothetical protein
MAPKEFSTRMLDEKARDGSAELEVPIASPVLKRLLDEVRGGGDLEVSRSYDRTYNRHNR